MEKVKFAFADGNGEDEFFILEETKINGSAYILVAESEDDDAECLILKDVRDEESGESVYEIVENEKELQAVSKGCLRNFLKMSVLNSDLRRKLHCMLWELLRVSTGNRTVIYKI